MFFCFVLFFFPFLSSCFRRFVRLFFTNTQYALISLYFQFQYFFSTSCFRQFLQGKYSKPPTIFATAEHYRSRLRHDATTVWLEDVTATSFKICLRELQNFAGVHEDISVVGICDSIFPISIGFFFEKRLITEQNSFKKMGNIMNYVMYHRPLLQVGNLLNSTPT